LFGMTKSSVTEQNGPSPSAPSPGSSRRAEAAERAHEQHMPEAQATVRAHLAEDRRRRMELARYVATVEARLSFVADACTSIYEWLLRCGVSPREAVEIRDLGRALRVSPEVAVRVENGSMTIEAAGCVGRALSNPALQRPGDDWVALGTTSPQNPDPIRTIRRLLRKREEEAAQRKITVPVTLEVADEVRDVFERARILASRKANQTLTPGQALGVVSTFYIQRNDPLAVKPGTRRMGPVDVNPDGASGSRTIPAEVMRLVRLRAGDRCEVPGCPNRIHLELCHLTPHAEGGGREAWLLFLFCTGHHWMYDNGLIFFRGRISEDGTKIEGIFLDAHGNVLGALPQTDAPAPAPAPAAQPQTPPVAPTAPVAHDVQALVPQAAPLSQTPHADIPQTAPVAPSPQVPQAPPTPRQPQVEQASPVAQIPKVLRPARGARASRGPRFGRVPPEAQVPEAGADTALGKEVLGQHSAPFAKVTDFRESAASAVSPLDTDGSASAPTHEASEAEAPAANAPTAHAPVTMVERMDDGSSVVAEAADATWSGASVTGGALRWDGLPQRSARPPRYASSHCGVRGPNRKALSWTTRAGSWNLPSGP
jgi:hypothetical protein